MRLTWRGLFVIAALILFVIGALVALARIEAIEANHDETLRLLSRLETEHGDTLASIRKVVCPDA